MRRDRPRVRDGRRRLVRASQSANTGRMRDGRSSPSSDSRQRRRRRAAEHARRYLPCGCTGRSLICCSMTGHASPRSRARGASTKVSTRISSGYDRPTWQIRTPADRGPPPSGSRRHSASIRSRCALPQVTMPTFACALGAILVDAVGAREMARVELRGEARLDREARRVGPAVVQPPAGGVKPSGAGHCVCNASRSTVEARFDRFEILMRPSSATAPMRPNSSMSAMFAGFTTGMCHAIIAKSLWCGIDDGTQPWSSPATSDAAMRRRARTRCRASASPARSTRPCRTTSHGAPSTVRSGSASTRCVPSVMPRSSLIAGRKRTPPASSSFFAFPAGRPCRAASRVPRAGRVEPCSASTVRCISSRRTSACVPVRRRWDWQRMALFFARSRECFLILLGASARKTAQLWRDLREFSRTAVGRMGDASGWVGLAGKRVAVRRWLRQGAGGAGAPCGKASAPLGGDSHH